MEPIAVVGMSTLFPGSASPAAFWGDILEGHDRMSEVPPTRWLREDYFDAKPGTPDKVYVARGGFLPEMDFSPIEFGLPPTALPSTDTAQLLALVVAKRALEEATRGRLATVDRSRISVVLGVASTTQLVSDMSGRLQIPVAMRAMRAAGLDESEIGRVRAILESCYVPWQETTFPGLLGNVVAGRVANRLDLGGTNAVIDAACASSLAAVHLAANELTLHQADVVVSGGVDTLNDILMYMCFAQSGALSLTGDCRPFSAEADGTMLGEGVGMLVLKRLADAERDGDSIYGVIRGIGTSSDGRAKSIYAPDAAGQAQALRHAYRVAGYGPDTVELVEAHGTGTRAGDAAEVAALKAVFEEAGALRHRCALGSVKSQIGHTKAAAGAAGLVKLLLSLHHKVLPGTIKVKSPSPALALEQSPFCINTETRPWVRANDHPRRGSVSALGFGGTNFHVTVEEYVGTAPRPPRLRAVPTELVLLSAQDAAALGQACRRAAMGQLEKGALASFARRSHLDFDAAAQARVAVVTEDETDLHTKLGAAAESLDKGADAASLSAQGIHVGLGAASGPVAFLFPGQGSQYVGMGRDLAIHFECARAEWDRAANLVTETGERLHDRVFPPPVFDEASREELERRLRATEWAQPALVAASLAMLRILERLGVRPILVAGHSLGELTALTAASTFDPTTALAVARRRGELCAAAPSIPGAMLAISAKRELVESRLAGWHLDVVVANHNAPDQVVLSGAAASVEEAERRFREAGIGTATVPVSTAFHSPLLAACSAPFRSYLETVKLEPPRIPTFANATAALYPTDRERVSDDLAGAIARPVRFVEQVEAMYAFGARTFVEVGPKNVLTRLVGRCLRDLPHVAVSLDSPGKHGVTALWNALGMLSAAGVPLGFAALWEGEFYPEGERVPPKNAVAIAGRNFGKPYPPPPGDLEARPRPAVVARPGPSMPEPLVNGSPPPKTPPEAVPVGGIDIAALHQLQAPALAAQLEFQRAMTESHTAFLRAIEASYAHLGLATGAVASAIPARHEPVAVPLMSPMEWLPAPTSAPKATVTVTHEAPSDSPSNGAVRSPSDLVGLMLSVVAEKTGYPIEMIELTQDLESDLGIDSIKRVEILAAVRDREPTLPSVDPGRMARMRTLGEIVKYFGESLPAQSAGVVTASAPADLVGLMLSVVAEKTGYPVEMIELTQDLESDLGIDSIKRVEILAAVRDREPTLPSVDPGRVARMRTLGEIVKHFRESHPAAPDESSPAQAETNGRAEPVKNDASATPGANVGRFRVQVAPCTPSGLTLPCLLDVERVCITSDGGGVADALAGRLKGFGIAAEVVSSVPDDARAVVFLGGLRAVGNADHAIAVQHEAFSAAKTVASRFTERGGAFVTVQDTGGDFGLAGRSSHRAWLGGLVALARTAAAEWPKASVLALDVERGSRSDEALADAIVEELLAGGLETEIGLPASGARLRIESVEAETGPANRPVEQGAVFVVSGGGRGVTAHALAELARTARPRFVLLGRSELLEEPDAFRGVEDEARLKRAALDEARAQGASMTPLEIARRVDQVRATREVRDTIARLSREGSEVRYIPVDVRDGQELARVLDQVRAVWGPVRGLVHAAGVLADALIANKTDEQFRRVFDTKVHGLRALLDATKSDPLGWICLFSSVAAHTGNAGQADYAMANEILNHVAAVEAQRRGPDCRVVSIGWGPWAGGMVTASLQKHFAARGVRLLPVQDGAAAFVREVQSRGAVNVIVGSDVRPRGRDRNQRLKADVFVDGRTWPQLADHRIQGKAVLPMVIAVEWFARLARLLVGQEQRVCLRDLQVVRGILLTRYDEGARDHFHLVAEPQDTGGFRLELRDAAGGLHYTAGVDPGAHEVRPMNAELGLQPTPWKHSELYGLEALFHGPSFQVIRRVEGISERGARATLVGTGDCGWPGGPWCADPPALDGGLQLAFLFGLRNGGRSLLPMRVRRIVYSPGSAKGPIVCQLLAHDYSPERLVCDLSLEHEGGGHVATLEGLEMFTVPTGTRPR